CPRSRSRGGPCAGRERFRRPWAAEWRCRSFGVLFLGPAAALGLGGFFCFLHRFWLLILRLGDGDRLLRHLRLHDGDDPKVALSQHRHDPRDVMPDLGDLARVLELPNGVLEAELVELPARGAHPHPQLVCLQHAQLVDFHLGPPPSADVTKRVLIGSLAAASFMASFATSGVTPPISNSTRPGLTTATQPSGLPLPEPMRVSAGFLVIDLSGKIRIQIWPPRLTCRVMARRAASICRLLIQHASIACSPKSP